jgi:hypothetical protein
MKYPIEKRQALYKIMDTLKGKKTAYNVWQFAINMGIIMEEEFPLQIMRNEYLCFKNDYLTTPKRWKPHFLEICSIVRDCLKYY